MSPFDPSFDDLPQTIPIFPLAGVLLLPGGRLPLNVFEPRYLNMTADALAAGRIIGMVQPTDPEGGDGEPPVYPTGCAGRITAFSETEDGRYLITLSGVCRFDIVRELPLHRGYRRVVPDWSPYRGDFDAAEDGVVDRERLVNAMSVYFREQSIEANWDAIRETPDERLVTTLAMICPFAPNEKQALLECPDLAERSRVMTALMEMAALEGDDADALRQ